MLASDHDQQPEYHVRRCSHRTESGPLDHEVPESLVFSDHADGRRARGQAGVRCQGGYSDGDECTQYKSSTSNAMGLSAQLAWAAWPGGSRARGRWPSHARFRPVLGRLIFGTASCHRPARRPVTVWQLEVGTKAERGASPTSSEIGPARRGLGRTLILTGWQCSSGPLIPHRPGPVWHGTSGRAPHRTTTLVASSREKSLLLI